MLTALTCSPSPSAARRTKCFNPKGRRCPNGGALSGCSQAGAGLQAASALLAWGLRARPRTARTRGGTSAAAAPFLVLLRLSLLHSLHGAGRRCEHGARSGCRRQAQLRLGADPGCGRRRKGGGRREGGDSGGRDAALGRGYHRSATGAGCQLPSWARRRQRDFLYLPETQRSLLKRDPESEQPARPRSPRLSSFSLTGYTDGALWIKIRSRARGWGASQFISRFAFESMELGQRV